MPVTGRFEADFSSFYDAVTKAEVKLADFTGAADKVGPSLNRMVEQFQGTKLIEQANLAVEAIDRIGGIANLTKDELQQVAAQAQAAMVKMQAMGVAVPANLRAIAAEFTPIGAGLSKTVGGLEAAAAETKTFGEELQSVGEAAIGLFGAQQLIEFALNIGKTQQALQLLSRQTQINTDDLQDLSAATQAYGVDNQELARAIFSVSQRVAGGDESLARGLHEVGLTLDDLKGKNPSEQFLEIEHALGQLQGGLRDTAAAAIFPQKLALAMSQLSTGIDQALASARQMPKVTKEQSEQLAEYADTVDKAKTNISRLTDVALVPLAQNFNATTEAMQKGQPAWKSAALAATDFLTGMIGLETHFQSNAAKAYVKNIQDTAAATQAATAATEQQTEALSAEQAAEQFITTMRRDAEKELEPWQKRDLDALREMGKLNQQNAAAIGVSADQFNQYTENVRKAQEATKILTELTAKLTAESGKLDRDTSKTIDARTETSNQKKLDAINTQRDAELARIQAEGDAAKAQLRASHADTADAIADIDAKTAAAAAAANQDFDKLATDVGVDFDEINQHTLAQVQELADNARDTYLQALATPGVGRDELEKLKQNYRDAEDAVRNFGHGSDDAGKSQQALKDKIDATNAALQKQIKAALTAGATLTMVGSQQYDLSTEEGIKEFERLNPMARVNAPPEYFKTHTLAQAILDGLVTMGTCGTQSLGGWASTWTPPPDTSGTGGGSSSSSGSSAGAAAPPPAPAPMPPAGGKTAPGWTAPPLPPVNVHVSGVFDPASADKIGQVVGDAIAKVVTTSKVLVAHVA